MLAVDASVESLAKEMGIEIEFWTVGKIRIVVITFPDRCLDFKSAFQGEIPYEKASVFDEIINYNQWLAAVIIKTQREANNMCWRQYMYYGYIITSEWYQCLWQDTLWDREIHEQCKTINIKAKDIIKMWIEAREKWKLEVSDLVDN